MSFNKTGNVETVDTGKSVTVDFWNSFKKSAKKETGAGTSAVVADFDKSQFTLVHTTIMASVDLEDNGYWITSTTEKYINDNGDAWPRDALLTDYSSFRNARVYVEHDQNPERARGKVFDTVARNMGDTVLIDLLIGVDNRHSDLVANIRNGICNATSMGCTTQYTKCSICGNLARSESEMCEHVAQKGQKCKDGKLGLNLKGRMVKCTDGKNRKCAELCYESNFFDASIVSNPAFKGAVFRSIVASEKIPVDMVSEMLTGKISFSEKENFCNIKVASQNHDFNIIHDKSASSINITVANNNLDSSNIELDLVDDKMQDNKCAYHKQFVCDQCKYSCDKWMVKISGSTQTCPKCHASVQYSSEYSDFFNSTNFDLLDFSKRSNTRVASIRNILSDPIKIADHKIIERIMRDEGINRNAAKAVLWSDIRQVCDAITAEMVVDKIM